MIYDPAMHDSMMGFLGNVILINGQAGSTAVVPESIVRLRLLNASNARIFDLSFASGRPLHLIATDGGNLPAPQSIDRISLAPGERAEVLVDFTAAQGDRLISRDETNAMMGGGMMGDRAGSGPFDVLAFAMDQQMQGGIDRLPDDLGGSRPQLDGSNAPRRQISLDMMMGGGMMGGMMRRLTGGGSHGINGQSFDMGRIDFEAKTGEVERWQITAPMMKHPFHVHGTRFQVIAENGRAPQVHNRGWKDTVLVDGSVDILVRFDRQAPRNAPYMYHCHILEHEDGGMMGQFTVA
jgi:FtsP/CotA-like multicopper oxidase with cupredoxin domain